MKTRGLSSGANFTIAGLVMILIGALLAVSSVDPTATWVLVGLGTTSLFLAVFNS